MQRPQREGLDGREEGLPSKNAGFCSLGHLTRALTSPEPPPTPCPPLPVSLWSSWQGFPHPQAGQEWRNGQGELTVWRALILPASYSVPGLTGLPAALPLLSDLGTSTLTAPGDCPLHLPSPGHSGGSS